MVKRRVYDNEKHAHFVTFSCYRRRQLLQQDQAKRIVIGQLANWLAKRGGICTGFVIMPDHVHALLWFSETGQLSPFMNKWKDQSSHEIKKLDYMHLNPVRAGLVEQAVDYRWSSARWYLAGKAVGLPIAWPPGLETEDEFVTGS